MIWAAIMAGFGAGLLHVLTGPDHLAAVAPLTIGKGSRSWRTGLQWAFGHCGGVLLIGLLAVFLRELLPIDSISLSAEKLVGMCLMGVGAWGISRCFSHMAEPSGMQRDEASKGRSLPLAIGVIHGLAGSSHLLGVIPGLLFPSAAAVCAYFIGFAAGTVGGMTGFSAGLGLLPGRTYRGAMAVCSCVAVVLGGYWLVA